MLELLQAGDAGTGDIQAIVEPLQVCIMNLGLSCLVGLSIV